MEASATSAKALLDKLLSPAPFPISGIQVDGGSEFKSRSRRSVRRACLEVFVCRRRRPDLIGYAGENGAALPRLHQENKGLIASLNMDAGLARVKYIAGMDADDISLSNRLALQVSVLEKERDLGALGGAIEIINSIGTKISGNRFPTKHSVIRSQLIGGRCPISHPTAIIRKEARLSVGGYRGALADAEDYDL